MLPGDVATARYATKEGWGHVSGYSAVEEPVMSAIRTLQRRMGTCATASGRRAREVAVVRH